MSGYDAIVVGSGAGGAAAAYALATRGRRVLILERGERLPRDGSTLEVDAVVTRGRFLSREVWSDGGGRALRPEEHFNLGGKTKWYGAALLRFAPHEFGAEPDFRARGWPIGYADLVPYYEQAERLLGVRQFECEPGLARLLAGLGSVTPAWQSTPLPLALSADILGEPNEAAHFDGFASVGDFKGDAEVSLLSHIVGLPNAELRTGAEVQALLPAAAGGSRVDGVRLVNGEQLRARTVLLAAGALHSPRLLAGYLAATPLQPPPPGAALVGRNLKMHLLTAVVALSGSRQTDLLRKTMLTANARFPHSSVQPLGFGSDLIATLVPRFVPRALARAIGARAYGFFLQTEDGSDPENRVLVGAGAAAGAGAGAGVGPDARRPVLDYDAARLPASRREHAALVGAFQFALLRSGYLSFSQRVGPQGTAHVCGTLLAGADARESVVDHRAQVHGISSLYVVDGSVLPRSSRANPALSIYAWGLRAGYLLAEELQR
jgi:choline dehydrogenase-like flavoprotein